MKIIKERRNFIAGCLLVFLYPLLLVNSKFSIIKKSGWRLSQFDLDKS